MYMNKKDFFTWAGYMAERLDFPCDTCPVRKYKNENKDYEVLCAKSCREAIENVFSKCQE